MIYCGYQGCGKSTYCRTHENTVDFDSSAFKKSADWEALYVNMAKVMSDSGKNVFISAHHEVLNYLLLNAIPFELFVPAHDKEVWRKRLEFRYFKNPTTPNLKAIADFEQNFERDMDFYDTLENSGVVIHRVSARIATDLESFIK